MKDFELDRAVDPVAIISNNCRQQDGVTPEQVFPIALAAWVYVALAVQVSFFVAYVYRVGVEVKYYGS